MATKLLFTIDCPTIADVPDILAVHQVSFAHGYVKHTKPTMGATPEALAAFVHGRDFIERKRAYWEQSVLDQTSIVARLLCGPLVGFGEGMDREDISELTALYVLPSYQRSGVGSALLQTVQSHMRHPTIRLGVTRWAPAVTFYENRGYRPTGRLIPTPEPPQLYGINLEQMELELRRRVTLPTLSC